jgi:hypothetical protein
MKYRLQHRKLKIDSIDSLRNRNFRCRSIGILGCPKSQEPCLKGKSNVIESLAYSKSGEK